MTFDLEKARAETEHLRENIEEEFSCMCGVCHVCGFNPEEMKEALAEIERLRASEAGLSKAVIDIQEERDLAQAEFRTYHKAWEEQATRIKELEEALVDARGKLFHQFGDAELDPPGEDDRRIVQEMLRAEGKIGPDAALKKQWDEVLDEAAIHKKMEELPTAPGAYRPAIREEAIRQLRAEGKIGPDAKPRSWQITDERKAAVEHLIAVGCGYGGTCGAISILRTMLTEAGQ